MVFAGGGWLGCGNTPDTPGAYQAWLQDPAHGLVDMARAGGIQLTMQYRPAELVAHQRGQASDSLLHFRMTVKSTESEGDIMMRGVRSLEAYRKRMRTLSLHMRSRIRLETPEEDRRPLHVSMGNDYGLTNGRKFAIVFADPSRRIRSSDRVTVVFVDDVLGTGITRFTFDGEDLRQIPPFPSAR